MAIDPEGGPVDGTAGVQEVRSEQHRCLLFETLPQGIVYQDADGIIISMNPAAERILGKGPAEFLGRVSVDEEYHTLREDGSPFPGMEHPSTVALRTGQEVGDVIMGVYNPREQAYRWINTTAVPLVRPGEDKPYQVYTHFSDITELRQTERALQHSERRFRKLFEADLIGVFITKPDGTFLDCNDAMVKMLGYDSREEVLRRRSSDFYVDPEFRREAIRILQKEGAYLGQEGRVWRKDGSIAHLLGAAVLLRDEETGEPYVQGVAVDITQRKNAEERLAENLKDLELLSVSATHYLEAVPSNELFRYTAQQLQEIAGSAIIAVSEYSPGTNQTIVRAMAGPEDKLRRLPTLLGRDPVGLAFTVAQGTRERMVRGRLERVEGGIHDLTFHQMPLPLATRVEQELQLGDIYGMPFYLGDDFMGTVAVATDSAEGLQNRELMEAIVNQAALALKRTRTEEALRESEQALRDLTATLEVQVAQRTAELEHRARQLQKLAMELSETEDRQRKRLAEILHDDLQQVLAAAKFHVNLMKSRTRHDASLQVIAAQIDHMLKDAIEKSRSLSHELSPAVLHHGDFAETLRWFAKQVHAKHGLLVHVYARDRINVQSDALKAFLYRAASELLFNVVKHARVSEARVQIRQSGGRICLVVSDRGRGFDPQELREAPGFGLLSIRERVELLGGRMKIRSAKGKGSTFLIVVPDARTAGAKPGLGAESSGRATGGNGGRLRVLLADDHEIVRQGLMSVLSEEDAIEIVGEAANGREAVDLAGRLEPDVVIMDVSMPLIDGDEATRQIKMHLPNTRVIALSMYEEPDTMETMYRAGAESYVLKTAPSEELVAAIRGKQSNSQGNLGRIRV